MKLFLMVGHRLRKNRLFTKITVRVPVGAKLAERNQKWGLKLWSENSSRFSSTSINIFVLGVGADLLSTRLCRPPLGWVYVAWHTFFLFASSRVMFWRCHVMYAVVLRCRSTVTAASSFLEAFQRVADMATNTRGKYLSAFITLLTDFSIFV